MKKKGLKVLALLLMCTMITGVLASCGNSKETEEKPQSSSEGTNSETDLSAIQDWDGVVAASRGQNSGNAKLVGSGISVVKDESQGSYVLRLEGKDGYLELPGDIWANVTDGFTIAYQYKADADASDNAKVFQTNICGYGVGDTFWYDAPEISLTVGGTFRNYIGGRTINGVYNALSTYNNGVGADDKAYAEPNGHKVRYEAKIGVFEKEVWNQVVIAVSSADVVIYVNGEAQNLSKTTATDDLQSALEYLFGSFVGGENLISKYVNTSIGNSVYADTPNYKGCVDNIQIYHRTLAESEVTNLPEDVTYMWNFEEDTISVPEGVGEETDLAKYMGKTELTEVKELATVSPDEKTKVQIWKDTDGSYYYSVTDGEQIIIETSKLGMELSEGDLTKALTLYADSVKKQEINETYSLFTGPSDEAANHCNETTFVLQNEAGSFTFAVRAYDDGIAYRYLDVTAGKDASVEVTDELSEVILPKNSTTWAFQLNATYEGEYIKRTGNQLKALSQTLSTPMLANVGEYWVLLTEAAAFNNDGQYCTSALKTESGSLNLNWTFGLKRDPAKESVGELDSPGHLNITEVNTINGFDTPWRVAVISEDLNEFTNSSIIIDLNPSADEELFADTSYINPGKVAWSWWSEDSAQGDYNKHVEYIDFASQNGWEYVCLDAGWRAFEDRLDELCAYAAGKNVGIFVWINYRDMTELEDLEYLFAKWKTAGVVGLKTDYFESDEPKVLKVMENVAVCSAKNQLMVLYHGCIRPGGECRTYPNILSTEAVQGEEWHKWFNYPTVANCLMYPFSRNICGSMDYTPVATKVGSNDATYGFGLAQTIVYESALQHFAYAASAYKNYAGLALLNHIPTEWNESKLVEGYPGEYVTYARRNGDNWFIGTMTLEERTIEISLDFLGDGTYNAYVYGDDESASKLVYEVKEVSKSDTLTINLCANGGAAVMITKGTIDTSVGENEAFNNPDYIYYEAESKENTLGGTAVIASSAFCSGSQKVGYVGNGAANTLTFNNIHVDKAGTYKLVLFYCSGENRKVQLTVNGATDYMLESLYSGDYVHPATAEISIELEAGDNTITLSNASYYAPDIDMIAISKEAE